jgi:hypothetical protein
MSRRGLRRLPLVAMVLLGMNVHGQTWSTADLVPLVIGCPDRPSHAASAVTLTVDKAWVDENSSLFADLLVTNGSDSAIRLPRLNVCQRYWGSRVDPILRDDDLERPPLLCGGEIVWFPDDCNTLGLFSDPLEMLLAEKDIETIAPGGTALLRAVYLDQFVDRERAVRSFEVFYTGWSKIEVSTLPAKLAEHKTTLAEASARQCSLYGGVLGGRGEFLIHEPRVWAPGEVIVINTQPWWE